MIYNYDLNIAGLLLRVSSSFELTNFHELSPFIAPYDPGRPPNALYDIQILPASWTVLGQKIAEDAHSVLYRWKNELHRYYFWSLDSRDRYVLTKYKEDAPEQQTIFLQADTLDRILPQFRLAAFLSPERLLMQKRGIMLHAALVDWNSKGILFVGPSGIGKSTQAQLWTALEGAQILNGDRAILRYQDGQYVAWGSPYAGTSRIYQNRCVSVETIVILSQGPENILKPVGGVQAISKILRECTALTWNHAFMSSLMDELMSIVQKIPVYHLTCTPDHRAVDILKQELKK